MHNIKVMLKMMMMMWWWSWWRWWWSGQGRQGWLCPPVKILPAEDLAISTEAFLVEHKPLDMKSYPMINKYMKKYMIGPSFHCEHGKKLTLTHSLSSARSLGATVSQELSRHTWKEKYHVRYKQNTSNTFEWHLRQQKLKPFTVTYKAENPKIIHWV